jgi:hypothetical protein
LRRFRLNFAAAWSPGTTCPPYDRLAKSAGTGLLRTNFPRSCRQFADQAHEDIRTMLLTAAKQPVCRKTGIGR